MAFSEHYSGDELWSEDDSSDDDYNYLNALDNLNWNSFPKNTNLVNSSSLSIGSRNVSKVSKSVVRSETSLKPAVAVKSKSNRNEVLFKDIIASEKDKTKDLPKSEDNNENKKRDFDEMKLNEDIDEDIIIESIETNGSTSHRSDNTFVIPKNKRPKVTNFKDNEYNIKEVLDQKKANHEKNITNNHKNDKKDDLSRVKGDRLFGKAFSPTVYSPEVTVMKSLPPTNVGIINKALTFSEETTSDSSKYNHNLILAIILDWNTKWLQECNQIEVPNTLSPFGEGIGLKTCYESLEEYQSAYIPLILFETWAQIHKDFNSECFDFDAIKGPEITSDENFIKLKLHTISTKNGMKNYPIEGYLILLEVTIDYSATNEKRKLVLFGYIQDLQTEKITSNTTLLQGLIPPPPNTNRHLLKYSVLLSKKAIRFVHNQAIKVKVVHYLRPTKRQLEMMSNLYSSSLFKDILRPRSFTCNVVVPDNLIVSPNFNESQNKAIVGSFEALNRPYAVPKVLFIQGPPGTGKTHTLIGIIKYIYIHCENNERLPRILICAPSNGAVDEISRRLYKERQFLHKHKIERHRRALRCVRVGKESHISPDVRNILFETLLRDNTENEIKKINEQKEKKIKSLETKIQELDQQIANLRAKKKIEEKERAEKEASNLMIELQRISANNCIPESNNKSRLRFDIMVKADIVLSTLNSCHSPPIEKLYQQFGANTFDCVIVDEASQCSEPELLMPLAYKMTKMILIGDPMQLPATVISKKASTLGLGRSLFERFYHYFRECEQKEPEQKSPILLLKEQYRMHPQICEFPSKQFYDGKLISSQKVINCREFKLKPYIVFDITDTIENKSDPTNKYNELEANFVIRLLSIIDNTLSSSEPNPRKFSVGIITPYNGQKSYLNNKLNEKVYKSFTFEINTVDGFQGQERDIIILSAVRAFDYHNSNKWQTIGFLDSVQRMNVALTRAKYSMILCISGRSLETNKNWKLLIDDAIKRANVRFKVPSTLADDKLKRILSPIETINIIE